MDLGQSIWEKRWVIQELQLWTCAPLGEHLLGDRAPPSSLGFSSGLAEIPQHLNLVQAGPQKRQEGQGLGTAPAQWWSCCRHGCAG